MGRTDMGEWSSWRASNWTVIWMVRGDGATWGLGEKDTLRDEVLGAALSDFVIGAVVPASDALAIWRDIPPESISRSGKELQWSVWQHKTRVIKLVAIIAVCALIGLAVSRALIPYRK